MRSDPERLIRTESVPAVGANGAGFEFPTHYGVLQGQARDTGNESAISGLILPG
jgi:hypothetical protein